MALSQDDLEHIRQLISLVEGNGLTELTVTQPNGLTVEITAGAVAELPAAQPVQHLPVAPQPSVQPVVDTASPPAKSAVAGVPLESPMVGVFYRSQTPEDPPFAREGEVVQIGQTIGLIEAMKVFSEIPAERNGTILRFAATNGQLVQLGQAIAFIEPL